MRMTRRTRVIAGIAALAASAAVLSGCSSSKSSTTGAGNGTPTKGGTVNYAEYPGAYPTWIWPLVPPNQDSTTNVNQFEFLFYKPLYFWGTNNKVALDYNTSIGEAPVWSNGGKTVSVTLKNYKWSNGESVDAQDVLFWINMAKVEGPLGNLAYYTTPNPKLGAKYFPDNIVSATASGQTFTLNLDKAYNQTWFLDNELSQITPMPMAWDMTSATAKGSCATATLGSAAAKTACAADYAYLSKQAADGSTFVNSPLWSVVDGAWKLTSYNGTSGAWDIAPNPDYSGSDKPYLDAVDFKPYTSDTSEYAALKAGGKDALNIGYLTQAATPVYDASNPNSNNPMKNKGYSFADVTPQDGIQYYQINFGNTDVGQMFQQGYFTKAVQETVDQTQMISKVDKGWGYPTTGVVPTQPAGNPILASANQGQYFSPSAAKAALSAHGWNTSTTPATCADPGSGANQCGAGIKSGQKAEFTVDFTAGNSVAQLESEVEASDAAQAGIVINFVPEQENQISTAGVTCAGSTKSGCWQGLFYGGWVYAPDYLPTGDALFATGAGPNVWSYSNATVDQSILATTQDSSASAFDAYETAIAANQPVIYQPNSWGNVGYPEIPEVSNDLHVGDSDPFGGIEPQDWYFVK
jgi:peptide/nickel transport system substrate-binding protein